MQNRPRRKTAAVQRIPATSRRRLDDLTSGRSTVLPPVVRPRQAPEKSGAVPRDDDPLPMEKELCMRTFRFALAAFLAVGVGNVFAQQFTTPSQLTYPSSRQQTPGLARYAEPAPKPMPVDQTEPAAPPVSGGLYSAPGGCDSCGMGTSCGCASGCGCGCGCCGNGYGAPFFGAGGGCWYGTVGGLVMTRSRNDPKEIAYDPNNVDIEFLGSQQVSPDDWQGGFELRVGRYLGCDHRLEAVYWTLDPDNQSASVIGPVNSSLDFGRLEFNGSGVDPWFQNSQYQQISMRSEFHNFELNLWGDHMFCGPCSPLQLSWLSGF